MFEFPGKDGRNGKSMIDDGINGFGGESGLIGERGGDGATIIINLSGTPDNLIVKFFAVQNGRKNNAPFDQQTLALKDTQKILVIANGGQVCYLEKKIYLIKY